MRAVSSKSSVQFQFFLFVVVAVDIKHGHLVNTDTEIQVPRDPEGDNSSGAGIGSAKSTKPRFLGDQGPWRYWNVKGGCFRSTPLSPPASAPSLPPRCRDGPRGEGGKMFEADRRQAAQTQAPMCTRKHGG